MPPAEPDGLGAGEPGLGAPDGFGALWRCFKTGGFGSPGGGFGAPGAPGAPGGFGGPGGGFGGPCGLRETRLAMESMARTIIAGGFGGGAGFGAGGAPFGASPSGPCASRR